MTSFSGLVERHPLKEKRKANKPLLERKRRARINDSLTELKQLVLSSLNKDASRYSKMEKADVLDMTVQFLKNSSVRQSKDSFVNSYRSGFNECANEIIRYIMTMDEIDHLLKAKLLSHLANTCKLADHQPPTINCQGSTQSSSPVPSPTLSPPLLCGSTVFPSLSPVSLQDHDRTVLSSIKLETLTSGLTLLPKLPLPPQNITTIPSQSKIKQLESSRQKLWRPW